MPVTVTVDEALLEQARAVFGEASADDLVREALLQLVRARRLQEFAQAIGTEDLVDMTLDELLELRAPESDRVER